MTDVETVYVKRLRTVRVRLRRSFVASEDVEITTVRSIGEMANVVQAIFAGLDDDQEHFVVIILNAASDVTGFKLVASGAQDHVFVDSKLVFRSALLLGAHYIVVAHNHPSGSSEPSKHDWELTRKLVEAGKVLDINVVDHVVVSARGTRSMWLECPEVFAG